MWSDLLLNTDYIKDVKRLGQPRAYKFVQNVGKVREVKTFPDELAYTPKWLVAEHRFRSWSSSESLEEIRVLTFRWENRMKGDFLKREGEFHNV